MASLERHPLHAFGTPQWPFVETKAGNHVPRLEMDAAGEDRFYRPPVLRDQLGY
jgi:hypothetical protein